MTIQSAHAQALGRSRQAVGELVDVTPEGGAPVCKSQVWRAPLCSDLRDSRAAGRGSLAPLALPNTPMRWQSLLITCRHKVEFNSCESNARKNRFDQ